MGGASGSLEQASANRDRARRARRLADTLTNTADRARLLRYADELEEQASDLEREAVGATAPGPGQPVPEQQQQ